MSTPPSWSRIALTGSTLSLLLATPAQAHENHDHSATTEPNDTANNDTAAKPPSDSNENAQSAADTADSSTPAKEPQAVEAVQTVPTNQPASTAVQTGFLRIEAIGLGEPLLGLIIAGPFVLLALKRRFQS